MGQVIWTEPALDDVRHILEYVSRDSARYAETLGDRFIESPLRSVNEPRTGWRVPEYDRDDVRELVVAPFRLIYVIRGDDCYVTTVVHGSRDLPRWWRPDQFQAPPESARS
jgi:addiction module RelE/StbE family toxin